MASLEKRLERYTLKHPEEVLLVKVSWGDETDEITIFKGFSSSLMRQTAFDPDEPVIPGEAEVMSVDRFKSPYHSAKPQAIEQEISWEEFSALLDQDGL